MPAVIITLFFMWTLFIMGKTDQAKVKGVSDKPGIDRQAERIAEGK
jgi:hypothetical protein